MKLKPFTFIFLIWPILPLFSQESQQNDREVIYEFRQYERIDLGSLEIQGQILAPGDLSIQQRSRNEFSRDLLRRENFRDFANRDLKNSY